MERRKYFVCGVFPCTAKKEEIMRDDLKDENGDYDMECVLTAREMGELVKEAGLEFIEAIDADTHEAPSEDSERIYIVARENGKEV